MEASEARIPCSKNPELTGTDRLLVLTLAQMQEELQEKVRANKELLSHGGQVISFTIFVLSHPWETHEHPDPSGYQSAGQQDVMKHVLDPQKAPLPVEDIQGSYKKSLHFHIALSEIMPEARSAGRGSGPVGRHHGKVGPYTGTG